VKFCQLVASVYPHMHTNFGWFILIFNKIAIIFLGVLIVFTGSSFEFQQVGLHWLIANDEWPNSPNLNPLDYQVWGQCWSLNKICNRTQNQFLSFKMHFSEFALPNRRKPLTTLRKTTTSDCRYVCHPMVDILNI